MKASKEIYLVKYSTGSFDDYCVIDIFATFNKKTAINYKKKFNRILKEQKKYLSQFETKIHGYNELKEEYEDLYLDRWFILSETNECYFETIKVR